MEVKSLTEHGATEANHFLSVIERLARNRGDAIALRGIDGFSLTYRELFSQIKEISDRMRNWGFKRADVVVIAIPDGPYALVAFLAVLDVAIALPVSPYDQPEEYERIIDKVGAKGVFMDDRPNAPITTVAARRGITLIKAMIEEGTMGRLTVERPRPPSSPLPLSVNDTAIMTLTSGTSATPKIVASTHASLATSVQCFSDWLGFSCNDRALCVMPFMHIHSLIRSTLPVLVRGGEVAWAPGFDQKRLLGWITEFQSTYMSAVPSMYRMLLREILGGQRCDQSHLRFVGIGSDRIDVELIVQIENALQVPVVQFYGLSETSPFIAMTQLGSKIGPFGATGLVNPIWAIKCVDELGNSLGSGQEGEIVVRGGTINGLVGSGPTDKQTIVDGWFHTGDIGRVDNENYLFVTGRIGDRITSGGKKIEPSAVEAVLNSSTAVRQAVVFGVRDEILGQRVVAAIVPSKEHPINEGELKDFAASRLTSHMVPHRIIFVDEIPSTNLGKISRSALAAFFASVGRNPEKRLQPDNEPERIETETESKVLKIVRRALKHDGLESSDDFFDYGCDSLAALSIVIEIEETLGVNVPPAAFMQRPNVCALARYVADRQEDKYVAKIVPVRPFGTRPPLFVMHGLDGRNNFAGPLADALGNDQPVFTFHSTRIDPEAIATRDLHSMAEQYAFLAQAAQPLGPYYLMGYSFGASLAFAIACRLVSRGREVAFLGLIDEESDLDKRHFGVVHKRPSIDAVYSNNHWLLNSTVLSAYPGRATYFRASDRNAMFRSDPTSGWSYIAASVDIVDIAGDHHSIIEGHSVARWAGALKSKLAEPGYPETFTARDSLARLSLKEEARELVFAALRECKEGNIADEIGLYEKALTVDVDQPFWVYGNLAEAFFQSNQIDAGVKFYQEALKLDPWPLTTLVRFAPLLKRHQLDQELLEALAQGTKVTVDHVSVAFQKALLFWGAKNIEHTELYFREALRLEPTNLESLVAFSDFLNARRRFEEAYDILQLAVKKNGKKSFVHARVGETLLRLNRLEEAESALQKSIAINPSRAGPYLALSKIFERAGRYREALASADRAMKLGIPIDTLSDRVDRLSKLVRD
jgi:acyl-CoA synthetase (AMP-forming)/AMP-acid ligase II/thioesterase domain-containing protein/acyl carrier protein